MLSNGSITWNNTVRKVANGSGSCIRYLSKIAVKKTHSWEPLTKLRFEPNYFPDTIHCSVPLESQRSIGWREINMAVGCNDTSYHLLSPSPRNIIGWQSRVLAMRVASSVWITWRLLKPPVMVGVYFGRLNLGPHVSPSDAEMMSFTIAQHILSLALYLDTSQVHETEDHQFLELLESVKWNNALHL